MSEIIIIGGGPVGLSIALNLANNNKKITLIEKDTDLGGSWRSRLKYDKYFTEHTPQVIFSNYKYFFKLLNFLKIDKNKYIIEPYGGIFDFYCQMISFFYKNMSISDIIKFFLYTMYTNVCGSTLTIKEMMEKLNFSKKGKNAMTMFSIAIADKPSKVLFKNLKTTQITHLVQLTDKNLFSNKIEKYLIKHNVTIIKNAKVVKLNGNSKKVESIEYIKNKKKYILSGDSFIATCPALNLYYLIKESPPFSNNWRPLSKMKRWAEKSSYHTIGFQLHFDKKVKWITDWGWSLYSDWYIVVLPISDFITDFTRDKKIKTVWSCTIIEGGYYSNNLKKTAHQSTKNEIINESLYQLSKAYGEKIDPLKVTFNDDVVKVNGKWVSNISGITINKEGIIPIKGKANNLFSVGGHNHSRVSNLETALFSSIYFLKKHYPKIKLKTDVSNFKLKYIIYIILIIIIFVK